MAADALVRLCDTAPSFDRDDIDRLVSLGVRADRVRALVETLNNSLSEAEAPASSPPAARASGARR